MHGQNHFKFCKTVLSHKYTVLLPTASMALKCVVGKVDCVNVINQQTGNHNV